MSLSRRPGTLGIQFRDYTEAAGAIRNGQGAAIDDVSVTGYKYGPVRSLAAGLDNQTVLLSWNKPARTPTDATADDRTLTYRVWRRVVGDSTWTELTTSRLTSPAFSDLNVPQGRTWDYAVQAWDSATGAGYGELAQLGGVGTWNLGTGRGYSVLEMVRAFERASGKPVPYRIAERRPGDIAACWADPGRAREELDWVATRGLDQMCADAWRWQVANPEGFPADG